MLTRCTVIILLLLGCANPALGHKLLLVAWIQGDQLMAETAFGTGKMAANIRVTVRDASDGEILLSGTTDHQGLFQITLDAKIRARGVPLLVSADDGAGHLVEQTIPAEELRSPGVLLHTPEHESKTKVEIFPDTTSAIDPALLQELVRDAVRHEMAPLRRDILALRQSGPGLSEILGGIGWIVGMAGLGALLLRRRTSREK